MNQNHDQYEWIRQEYPEIISKDQFYRIAHISKATALYLLQSGKVPCIDTGKKTRRYRINREDVIVYLKTRETYPFRYKAEAGWYTYRSHSKNYVSTWTDYQSSTYYNELSNLSVIKQKKFKRFITDELSEQNDILTLGQFTECIGYSRSSALSWINKDRITALKSKNRYYIPKTNLVEFLCSPYAFKIPQKSDEHLLLLNRYLASHTEQRG